MTPLEEAQKLLSAAAEETQYRTVGSRAYFATFNRVKVFAAKQGFPIVQSGEVHQNLSHWLRGQRTNALLMRIGARLGRMRPLRNRADYDQVTSFTRGYAADLVSDAEEIDSWISEAERLGEPKRTH